MDVVSLPIEAVRPYPGNPRRNEAAVEKVAVSLREFGFRQPIVVDAENVVIAGHTRLLAAQQLGMAHVPVHVARGLTEAQVRAYRLADNRTHEDAEWDPERLAEELRALDGVGYDLQITGFDEDELSELLADVGREERDPEAVPPLPPAAASVPGDVWLLGDHRLMCGDSTNAEQMKRLMNGQRAVCAITDPPYSVDYEESHKTRGGNKAVHASYKEADINPSDLLEFLGCLPTDLLIFSYSVNRHLYVLSDSLRKHRWEVRKELVWVKDTFSFWMGAAYQQKHEPFWICTRNGAGFRGNVDSKQSTVLEYPRPKAHELHPTAKPVEMWVQFVNNHSDPGELIVEPFSGSGTSIIAAQQTGRRCYAMELAPAYVDVAVERWQAFTGLQATLEADGRTFADVKASRASQTSVQ